MHIILQLESDFPQEKVNLTNTKPVCYEYSVTASGIPIPKFHSNEFFTTILVMPMEKGTPGTATWIVLPKHTYENSCCPACLDLQALDFKKCKANKLIIYSVGIHQLNPTNLLLECSAALLQHYPQIHMQMKITNQVCRYYVHQGSFLECKGKLPGQHLQICRGSARWGLTKDREMFQHQRTSQSSSASASFPFAVLKSIYCMRTEKLKTASNTFKIKGTALPWPEALLSRSLH